MIHLNNKFFADIIDEKYVDKIAEFLKDGGGFVYFNYNNDEELASIWKKYIWLINKKFNDHKNRIIISIFEHWVIFSVLNWHISIISDLSKNLKKCKFAKNYIIKNINFWCENVFVCEFYNFS